MGKQKKTEKINSSISYSAVLQSMRKYHDSLDSRDLSWRKNQLRALNRLLVENEASLQEALYKDLRKGPIESNITEIGFVKSEIELNLKNLKKWARPKKVTTPFVLKPGKSEIIAEPLGVALIIGAWNYPINLTLTPLVSCIAAGNAAILKPSELATHVSELLAELIPRYLDKSAFKIVQGGVNETTALLEERFDKIFFTGSQAVGAIVMKAAAKHTTPITLELGGKSPCIVDSSADIELAARRIVFGKYTNAGQTCVAPDYILAHEDIIEPLTKAFKRTITSFYGDDPAKSEHFARIINKSHHQRLVQLIKGQQIEHGGAHDEADLYLEPTLLGRVKPGDPVMQEEIFGPVLPIISVKNAQEAFNFVSSRDKPLAFYTFAKDKGVINRAKSVQAGGVCINDTIVHLGIQDLPFGGVGASGFGKYHGKYGFDDFSSIKSVFNGSTKVDLPVRYPPYGKIKRFILKHFTG